MSTPRVSVLMAVHDGARFLPESLASVLAQTWTDYELIVVDDASADATPDILDEIADSRLVRLRNDRNLGLTRSLNRGLEHVRAPYIARLDDDDVAEPERLARQLATLDARREVTVLGTWTVEIDERGCEIGGERLDASPAFIAWQMTHRNTIYHSTVMTRTAEIRRLGGYDADLPYAQDHDLWTRVLMAGGVVTLLPELLTRYRRTAGQVTRTHSTEQMKLGLEVRQRYCAWLLDEPVQLAHVRDMMAVLGSKMFEMPADAGPALDLIQRIRRASQRRAGRDDRRRIADAVCQKLLAQAYRRMHDDPRLATRLAWQAFRAGVAGPETWRRTGAIGFRSAQQLVRQHAR
ncbi:MAG: glycosyltransferase [Longimicrobiales bacterium]